MASVRFASERTDVLFLQLAVDTYRGPFFDELVAQSLERNRTVRVVAGIANHDPSHVTRLSRAYLEARKVNRYLVSRRVVVQTGVGAEALAAGVLVLETNPRVLSNWVWMLARRVLGRPTVLWGHAHPRAGRQSRTRYLRSAMQRMANVVVVYTEDEASQLERRSFAARVRVAPNSLLLRREVVPVSETVDPLSIVFVGRLSSSKKPALLLHAFARAVTVEPRIACLHIAGDGPLLSTLTSLALELGVGDRVKFHGWLGEIAPVRELYEVSYCAVSPGFVGLSSTQALGFGVPLLYSCEEPHAPEASLLHSGNSVAFRTDSVDDLTVKLVEMFRQRIAWRARAPQLSKAVRNSYTIEAMVEGMQTAIELANDKR